MFLVKNFLGKFFSYSLTTRLHTSIESYFYFLFLYNHEYIRVLQTMTVNVTTHRRVPGVDHVLRFERN